MPDPVVHFEVTTEGDVEGVRKFYADAFGWKIDANNPMNYGLVNNGGEGINGGIAQVMHGKGYATFYVQVDDLQQKLGRVESLGGSTLMPPMDIPDGQVSIAMFRDPAGNIVGLVKPQPMSEVGSEVHELAISCMIDAPRALVFKTWTNARKLTEWWGPHGMTTPVCVMDLKPGGVFRTVMRDQAGAEYPNEGIFLEVVEPERVVFTDAMTEGFVPAAQPFMTAIISFEDHGDKTKLTARALHKSAADRQKHEQMGFQQGWGEMLDRFAACVERSR